ncbi:hypothetical protein HY947_04960 [Candidatus Gottesmanbacteria bacterium]|nr:hypothetical protein [Candidatus Gottesmanbacteria bacterium]
MKKTLWTGATLTKQQLCFLDGISKEAKFSGGKKFSRAAIVRTALAVARKLNIDVSNVRTEDELERRFLQAFAHHAKTGK